VQCVYKHFETCFTLAAFSLLADRPSLHSAPLQHDSAGSRPAAVLTPAAARSAHHECWRSTRRPSTWVRVGQLGLGLLLINVAACRPVVVLAERDKTDMDGELRRELGKDSALEWHTRCGAPHSIADLERVGAGQARTIILMHPEVGVSNEARRPCRPSSVPSPR